MSFGISVTGLNAATRDLDVRGNNIANVSTIGFKRSRARFADVITTTSGELQRRRIGAGTSTAEINQEFTQGSLRQTNSKLDLAIQGEGFFALGDKLGLTDAGYLLSRRGSFRSDSDGYIVDGAGNNLLVIPPGEGSAVTRLQLPKTLSLPRASSVLSVGLNLDSSATVPQDPFSLADPTSYNFATSIPLVDSKGNELTGMIYFRRETVKTLSNPDNTWSAQIFVNQNEVLSAKPTQLRFDGAGSLLEPIGPSIYEPFNIGNGADPLSLQIDFTTGTTQGRGGFRLTKLTNDGRSAERFETLEIDKRGNVIASYKNGSTENLGRVLMARAIETSRLKQFGDGIYLGSNEDPNIYFGYPGDTRIGEVQSGAVENSNVNLTDELIGLINAQRMFQSNAKAIESMSEMTQRMTQAS